MVVAAALEEAVMLASVAETAAIMVEEDVPVLSLDAEEDAAVVEEEEEEEEEEESVAFLLPHWTSLQASWASS